MSLLPSLAFYLFAAVMLLAGAGVITARNPVHSVLLLILAFFNAAGLFVLLGAEFLAMILVIVYVGAVAVLFLFVVMMLDAGGEPGRPGFLRYLPFGAGVGAVLLFELLAVAAAGLAGPFALAPPVHPVPPPAELSNIQALGRIIYTDYVHFFQIAGLILLTAMVGAIVLTLRSRPGIRRQSPARQIARRARDTLEIKKVKPGQGV